jgi:hypothetical protein
MTFDHREPSRFATRLAVDRKTVVEEVLDAIGHEGITVRDLGRLMGGDEWEILELLGDMHKENLVATEAGTPDRWRMRTARPICSKCLHENEHGEIHCSECGMPLKLFA